MRTILGLGIFICLFLHFNQKNEKSLPETKTDTLSTKQSAAREVKRSFGQVSSLDKSQAIHVEKVEVVENEDQFSADQDLQDEELASIPWAEIEEGWRSQLKEYLVSVDPEKADEMFDAYIGASQKYAQKVDHVEEGDEQDFIDDAIDPLEGLDESHPDAETIHTNTLKDIFGELFPQVEALHQEYVESIQYLNRSSGGISFSL